MDAMLGGMTSSQLAEWQAFFALEPWGADIEDHRAGVLASTIANMAGMKLRDGKHLAPADYFPPRIPPPEKTEADVRAQIAAAFGVKLPKEDSHG